MKEGENGKRLFRESDYDLLSLIYYIIKVRRLSVECVLERAGLEPQFLVKLARRGGMKNIGTRIFFKLCIGLAIHPYHFLDLLYQQTGGNRKYRLPAYWMDYSYAFGAITNRMMLSLLKNYNLYSRDKRYPYHDINKDSEITIISFMRTSFRIGTTFQDTYILLLNNELYQY